MIGRDLPATSPVRSVVKDVRRRIAPVINPNVRTVFLIEFRSPLSSSVKPASAMPEGRKDSCVAISHFLALAVPIVQCGCRLDP